MRKVFSKSALITLCLLVLCSTGALAQVSIPPQPLGVIVQAGDDALQTAAGSGTQASLNLTIPGGCGTTDATYNGIVSFKGRRIDPNNLGKTDTIVRRLQNTPRLVVGDTATVPLQMVALGLKSESPITATCVGGGARDFNVLVFLSGSAPQSVGWLTITLTNPDGGDFTSELHIMPKFRFRPTDGGADIDVDCGVVSDCGEVTLDGFNSKWTLVGGPGGFDPGANGFQTVPGGLYLDTDGDGNPDTYTIASSNLQAGFDSDFLTAARLFELRLWEAHNADPAEILDVIPPHEEEPTEPTNPDEPADPVGQN